MAAGLGFKDFVTGEVLTAADVDGYLMQGVWVFASAAARDAAVTSPQEGNFAYLKDTNVTTYYTGSAWANLDTTGMTNPMTTTGDTIYSSSGSTPARLGIGTANQVLRVNSGATAPEWATPASGGGMTLLATKTFNNTDFTASFTSIAGTYKNLLIVGSGLQSSAAGNEGLSLRLNNDTGSNYTWNGIGIFNGSAGTTGTTGTSQTVGITAWTGDSSSRFGTFQILINDYSSTGYKSTWTNSYSEANGTVWYYNVGLIYNSTTAITQVDIFNGNSTNVKAGTIKIYGVA